MGRLIDVDEFWRRVSCFDLDDEAKKVILIVLTGMPSAYGENADVVELVRCGECKYNPFRPRRFSDDDVIAFYAWCEVFAEQDGYCPFGKADGEE